MDKFRGINKVETDGEASGGRRAVQRTSFIRLCAAHPDGRVSYFFSSELVSRCSFSAIRNKHILSYYFSILAALGLIENNAENISAAMLVSPLMGPVMSVTFGVLIADRQLVVCKT